MKNFLYFLSVFFFLRLELPLTATLALRAPLCTAHWHRTYRWVLPKNLFWLAVFIWQVWDRTLAGIAGAKHLETKSKPGRPFEGSWS